MTHKIDKIDRVGELVGILNAATDAYDISEPIMSDKDWDELYFELVNLEKETGYILSNSPTQKIHFEKVSELKKVEHNHPLLSLDKTKDIGDLDNFVRDKHYTMMAKMDGLTISVRYINGKLVSAETRGDGIIGEDITHNARVIKNLPQVINYKDELIIDGEAIITYKDFEPFKDKYANPRNLVAGSVRLLDSSEATKRNISFIAWKVYKGFEGVESYSQKLKNLDEFGFTTVPRYNDNDYNEIIKDINLSDWIEAIKEDCEELGYPIDGCVIGIDNIAEATSMGDATAHHEKYQLAYKFYDEEYETVLLDIKYDVSRQGILTPVAIFKEIDDGTSINTRASLHNLSVMENILGKYPYECQPIWVVKANQIIPQISRAKKNDEELTGASYFLALYPPKKCPICGGDTEIKEDGISKILYCTNPKCERKFVNQIEHFCSKKGLDIKGLSEKTIEKLVSWGWLNSIKDLYELKKYRLEWIKKDGFGEKSVDKILAAIEASRHSSLDKMISALGIPEIGVTTAKVLGKRYTCWQDFREVTKSELLSIDGFGEIMVENILNFDYSEIDEMINNNIFLNPAQTLQLRNDDNIVATHSFIKFQEAINETNKQISDLIKLLSKTTNLDNETFCITGKLSKKRDEIVLDIENAGGKVTGSISSKTNYLVNNDINSTSSKNKKAKELNIPIITEEELYNMINGSIII